MIAGIAAVQPFQDGAHTLPKPMKRFAGFLRQDLDAVTAGLTLPWSSGVVEGHVNRVKTLKCVGREVADTPHLRHALCPAISRY